jgi:hypothetical protein
MVVKNGLGIAVNVWPLTTVKTGDGVSTKVFPLTTVVIGRNDPAEFVISCPPATEEVTPSITTRIGAAVSLAAVA